MKTMSDLLDRILELDKAATTVPWATSNNEPGDVVVYGPKEEWLANIGNWARQNSDATQESQAQQACEFRDAADADLIATYRTAAPALARALKIAVDKFTRLEGCDWVITPADRMDAVRKIGRDAFQAIAKELEELNP